MCDWLGVDEYSYHICVYVMKEKQQLYTDV